MGKNKSREMGEALPGTLVVMIKETKAGNKTLVIYKKKIRVFITFLSTIKMAK